MRSRLGAIFIHDSVDTQQHPWLKGMRDLVQQFVATRKDNEARESVSAQSFPKKNCDGEQCICFNDYILQNFVKSINPDTGVL